MTAPKKIDEGGPVFPDPMRGAPQSISNQGPGTLPTGLTLRDYFAGQALMAMLSGVEPCLDGCDCKSHIPDSRYAEEAYDVADAMIAHRKLAKGASDE